MTTKTVSESNRPKPTEVQIQQQAYRLYEQRGSEPGHALDDWLKAEGYLAKETKNATGPVPHQWQWHYRTLVRLRDALLNERNEHDQASRIPFERSGDPGDAANEKSEHDTLLAEISHEESKFVEVEAALERIRTGTYGICAVTGQPIGNDRLKALPWTRLCLAAAANAAKV